MEGDTESQVGWRGGDPESCDQPQSPRPRREKQIQDPDIRERETQSHRETQSTKSGTAETDQRSRMWLPSLPPCLSLPSSHSRVSSPSCASSTHPKQNSLGPGSLCPETGTQPPLCSSWLCVCLSVHVPPSVCRSRLVPTLHTALPHHPLLHTHTHCCPHFHWPRSCTPLYTYHIVSHTHSNPETCPGSPSLKHICTQGQKIHPARSQPASLTFLSPPSQPFTP